jgi:Tfp pilus assembly protein PilZ
MPSMIRTKRRDTRFEIRFPTQVRQGHRTDSFFTEDVSFRGVFLRTDTPPPLRRLVDLRLVLPPGDAALLAHGMVVHVVPHGNTFERVPGFGVQFYALDKVTREIWETFVREVAACCPESPYPSLPAQQPAGIDRRLDARRMAVLRIKVETARDLHDLYATDVSKGGMFVATELDLVESTVVVIHVAHPETAETFLFDAIVRHRRMGGRGIPRGVGVELLNMNKTRKEQFLDFVRGGISIGEAEDQTG